MRYMTVSEAAAKWGLTARSVQLHCLKGNIPGVNLHFRGTDPAKALKTLAFARWVLGAGCLVQGARRVGRVGQRIADNGRWQGSRHFDLNIAALWGKVPYHLS